MLKQFALKKAGLSSPNSYPDQISCVETFLASGVTQDQLFTAYLKGGADQIVGDHVDKTCAGSRSGGDALLPPRGSCWRPVVRGGAGALVALVLGTCAGGGGTGGAAAPSSVNAGASPDGGASAPAGEPGDPMAGEVEHMVRAAPDRRLERRMLAVELVGDWRREAGNDKDSADVMALLRRELSDKLASARGRGTDAGLEVMRAEVYDRRARALGRRSLALGKAVIDGAIADADARALGQQILDEVKALQAQIRALKNPDRVRVLTNDLQEVSLEATFAIARGATSRRLNDYQSSKSGAPKIQ